MKKRNKRSDSAVISRAFDRVARHSVRLRKLATGLGVSSGVSEALLWAISNTDWYPSKAEFRRVSKKLQAEALARLGRS